jgi:hypothetical protein
VLSEHGSRQTNRNGAFYFNQLILFELAKRRESKTHREAIKVGTISLRIGPFPTITNSARTRTAEE